MSNEFIEQLREKATENNEESAYRERLKKEYPWLTDDAVEEKVFVQKLTRMFNQNEREER